MKLKGHYRPHRQYSFQLFQKGLSFFKTQSFPALGNVFPKAKDSDDSDVCVDVPYPIDKLLIRGRKIHSKPDMFRYIIKRGESKVNSALQDEAFSAFLSVRWAVLIAVALSV